jgi:bacterioferritin-associated ferredoxin
LVTEVVAAGARNLALVYRATDAGRDCGACVFTVKRIITEHITGHHVASGNTAPSVERTVAALGVCSRSPRDPEVWTIPSSGG